MKDKVHYLHNMKLILLSLLLPFALSAQSYEQEIDRFRNHYVAEHLMEERSPIKYEQVKDLRFFPINESYKVYCEVEIINSAKAFTLITHTHQKKEYYKYAKLRFTLFDKAYELYVYQSKSLIQKAEYRNALFLPFTDDTNYESTFGGGRYIDLVLEDIKDNKSLVLDFNKSYNPYCAYAAGFNCPIPPKENDLKVKILAGEMNYAGEVQGEH